MSETEHTEPTAEVRAAVEDDTALACRHALDAAIGLRDRIAEVNVRRAAAGLPVTAAHVALHLGELLYGNLGSARRLRSLHQP